MARSSSSELSYEDPPYTQETYEPASDEYNDVPPRPATPAPISSLPPPQTATILNFPEPDVNSAEREPSPGTQRSPSPSSPPLADGQYERRVSLSTISLEPRRRRHHDRRYTYDDFKRLMTMAERDARDMRRGLRAALDRLEQSRSRAEHAERIALEMAARLREANEERVAAMKATSAAREELGMYKVQYQNAQAEIQRAQELLRDQDTARRDAEASAARARDTARALKQDRLVELAREEGRRMGYKDGRRAGERMGFYEAQAGARRQRRMDMEDMGMYDDYQPYEDGVDTDTPIDAEPGSAVREPPIPGQPRNPSVAGTAPRGDPEPSTDGEIDIDVQPLPRSPPRRRASPSPPSSERAPYDPSIDSSYTFVSAPPAPRHVPPPRSEPLMRPAPTPTPGAPSDASTDTLPVAPGPGPGSPYQRAPRLPEPNIPNTIPEVVNTESTGPSRRNSRRVVDDFRASGAPSPAPLHVQASGRGMPSAGYSPASPDTPTPLPQGQTLGGYARSGGTVTPVYVPPVPLSGDFRYEDRGRGEDGIGPIPQSPSMSSSVGRRGHRRSASDSQRLAQALRANVRGEAPPEWGASSAPTSKSSGRDREGPPPRWRPANITRPAPLAPQVQTQRSASTSSFQQPDVDEWYANQRAASRSGNSFYGGPAAPGSPRAGGYAPGSPRAGGYAPGSPRNGGYAPGSPRNDGYAPSSPRVGGYAPSSPRLNGSSSGNVYEDVQRRAHERDRPGQRTMVSSGGLEEPAIFLESPSIHSTQDRTPRTTVDSQRTSSRSPNPDRYLSPNRPVQPLPQQTQMHPPPPQPQFQPPPPSQQQQQPQYPTYLYKGSGAETPTNNSIPPNYFNSYTTSAMPRPPGVMTGIPRNRSGPPSIFIPSAPASSHHSPSSGGSQPRGGTPAPTSNGNLKRSSRTHGRSASSGAAYAPPSPRQGAPMLYAPGPGSPRASSPVLPVLPPSASVLQHPQRSHSRSGSGSPYPSSPGQRGAGLPIPSPSVMHARSRSSGSPAPLPTPSPDMRHTALYGGSPGDRRSKAGSDASLPPGRPGSPYAHYNPSEEANIAALAMASAERLPMTRQ